MRKRIAILTLALTAGVWGAGAAQRAGPPQMPQRGPGMRGGMGPASGAMPQMLLRQRTRLELTDEQVTRLEALSEQVSTASREAMLAVRSQRAQLAEALGAESVDLNEVRAHFDSARVAETRMEWLRIETGVQATQVLTDEQRAMVRDRAGRWGQGGMMPNRDPAMQNRRFRPGSGRTRIRDR